MNREGVELPSPPTPPPPSLTPHLTPTLSYNWGKLLALFPGATNYVEQVGNYFLLPVCTLFRWQGSSNLCPNEIPGSSHLHTGNRTKTLGPQAGVK